MATLGMYDMYFVILQVEQYHTCVVLKKITVRALISNRLFDLNLIT